MLALLLMCVFTCVFQGEKISLMEFNAGIGLFDKSLYAAYNTLCSDVKVIPICTTGRGQC